MGIKENIYNTLETLVLDDGIKLEMKRKIDGILQHSTDEYLPFNTVDYVYEVIRGLKVAAISDLRLADYNHVHHYQTLVSMLNSDGLLHVKHEEPDYVNEFISELSHCIHKHTFLTHDEETKSRLLKTIVDKPFKRIEDVIVDISFLYADNPLVHVTAGKNDDSVSKGIISLMIRNIDLVPIMEKYATITNSYEARIRIDCLQFMLTNNIPMVLVYKVSNIISAINEGDFRYVDLAMNIMIMEHDDKRLKHLFSELRNTISRASLQRII